MKASLFVVAGLVALTATPVSAQNLPSSAPQKPLPAPTMVTAPKIMMLRLYVADVVRAENFYHAVFGASVVQKMGENVRIMIFPGGALPGLILIQSPEVATMHGSFVIQMPELKGTLDLAVANGGKLQNTHFAEQMSGMPAQSSHFYDPDGNLIEVLQIGGGPGSKKP